MFKHKWIAAAFAATVTTIFAGSALAKGEKQAEKQAEKQGEEEAQQGQQQMDQQVQLDVEMDQPFGEYLVDANGRTLYIFTADSGDQSACVGECAEAWPPLITTGDPRAVAPGLDEDKLGTITREDGSLQVTYAGHPLYYFEKDSEEVEVSGQDVASFGGEWYLIAPDGTLIEETERTGMIEEGQGEEVIEEETVVEPLDEPAEPTQPLDQPMEPGPVEDEPLE